MELGRRSFLKACAVSAAMVTAGCSKQPKSAQTTGGNSQQTDADEWVKSVCRYCGTGCGVLIGVKKGKVIAVKGDPDNEGNKGLLCAKGYYLPQVITHSERVTKPLIRKDGKFVASTWDEAMELITSKFKEAIEQSGPDSVAFYGSGQALAEEEYVANKLFKGGIGTNNVDGNPRLCMASAVGGYQATFGADEPMGAYDDFNYADVFFFIGSNLAEAHPVLFAKLTDKKRKDPNTVIIIADPRKHRSHEIADISLQFIPGTDLALLNAMANIIVEEGLTDEEFIAQHTSFSDGTKPITYEEYKTFLKKFTPEYAEKKTGVPAAKLREMTRIFAAKGKNTMSMWTMGINQRTTGVWANTLIHNLHLLTGKICKPGSTSFSLTGQPSACGSVRETGALSHLLPAHRMVANAKHRGEIAKIWGIPPEHMSDKIGLHTMELFKACGDGRVKALWVMCTNPAHSLPNVSAYREGFDKVFMVVSEVFHPTATTQFADVILPAAFWCEKEGVYGNTERRTQHLAKAIDPPGEAKPDLDMLLDFARRLGYGDLFPFRTPEDVWNEYLKCTDGTDMELATYPALKEAHGIQWPVKGHEGTEGTVRRYVAPDDPYVKEGIDFYAAPNHKAVIFARPDKGPAEVPDAEYPFYLTTGRVLEHWHTATMTGKCDALMRAVPEQYVEINPKDATKLGINDGDKVRLVSRRGKVEILARVGHAGVPQPGLLFALWFQSNPLVNEVTIDAVDPGSKEPEFKICAVKLEKV
ncbi:nitrate reductase [Desulfitobacterium sp.]|uniref:molybdopterin oxidoreductase family protein n=1 Tax=Desulfitobacterium sp. TaxID=49981 RepID=UPI002B207417|nr:nitrate reductase [Desulfitobacterium sp.]MEA4902468.1 nitrate reductase [Desulfitobacterium sp.]